MYNNTNNKVLISGISTADLKVLTAEEMFNLFKKMQAGDPLARNDLVSGNLKLVLSILRKVNTKNENLDDLFQVGCVGCKILNLCCSYDPRRNKKIFAR